MSQDKIFWEKEGNNWFTRNKKSLEDSNKIDWPTYLIDQIKLGGTFKTVLELGCSNGWRLQKIANQYSLNPESVLGVEASQDAIDDARERYPKLNLKRGLLSEIPTQEKFDLVIVNFVFHWVDRSELAKSIAETDRVLKDGGVLVLGDFLPDAPQKRVYHHLPGENVYTYKQDYGRLFEALGIYKELIRLTYDHDNPSYDVAPATSDSRGVCIALRKSLAGLYEEKK